MCTQVVNIWIPFFWKGAKREIFIAYAEFHCFFGTLVFPILDCKIGKNYMCMKI